MQVPPTDAQAVPPSPLAPSPLAASLLALSLLAPSLPSGDPAS
jgi:hypothetical protein